MPSERPRIVRQPTEFLGCDDGNVEMITEVANLVRDRGLDVELPVHLRSTNNVVVWMCPSPVVAKIAPEFDASTRELHVAKSLAAVGAPVVPPIEIGINQPVNVADRWATFWKYVAHEGTATPAQVAVSLDDLHTGLAGVRDQTRFPPCWGRLESAAGLLGDPELPGGLSRHDRSLLRRAVLDGIAALASMSDPPHVLHGSPHRSNILVVDGEAVFIDFETVELGPLEWDLAHLDEEVAAHYPAELDQDLLRICRIAIGAATSAWCWEGIDRGADMRGHAELHLEFVRRALA